MILVDSSVWIDLLNNVVTEPARRLRELIPTTPLLIGDLILLEVLQGFRNEAQAKLVERSLRRFEASRCSIRSWRVKPPRITGSCAAAGSRVRKTIDLVIGTFCIERGHALAAQRSGF
jgi:predicted nucleic acid-binding protein